MLVDSYCQSTKYKATLNIRGWVKNCENRESFPTSSHTLFNEPLQFKENDVRSNNHHTTYSLLIRLCIWLSVLLHMDIASTPVRPTSLLQARNRRIMNESRACYNY